MDGRQLRRGQLDLLDGAWYDTDTTDGLQSNMLEIGQIKIYWAGLIV